MNTAQKAGSCVVLLSVAFAFGRFSAPEKTHVETKTLETRSTATEKKETLATATDRDEHHEVQVTEIVRPDGTRVMTTRTIDDHELRNSQRTEQLDAREALATRETNKSKDVVRSGSKLEVSLLAGPSVSLSNGVGGMVYGVHVSRPIIGPITVGLFGMSSGVAGVSVGLRF